MIIIKTESGRMYTYTVIKKYRLNWNNSFAAAAVAVVFTIHNLQICVLLLFYHFSSVFLFLYSNSWCCICFTFTLDSLISFLNIKYTYKCVCATAILWLQFFHFIHLFCCILFHINQFNTVRSCENGKNLLFWAVSMLLFWTEPWSGCVGRRQSCCYCFIFLISCLLWWASTLW